MAELTERLRNLWAGMSLVQRVVLLAVVLAAAGGVSLVVNWTLTPEMVLLYSDLDPQDASKIVEKLRDQKIEYDLRSGGTSVYVPAESKASSLIMLAGQGLPSGASGGYKILDDEQIGLSPERQKINYNRALEGELSRTVESIEGVHRARVHVVQPQTTLFGGRKEEASASVMISMTPGHRLGPGQVSSISYLVAGAVEGLGQQNVVVVDSQGKLWTTDSGDDAAASADSLYEYRVSLEDRLAREIEDLLAQVLGPGRAKATVSAEVETASITQTVKSFKPDEKVVTRNRETRKTSSGGGGGNMPGGGGEEDMTDESEFDYGATVTNEVHPPGTVEKISVAVLVDLSNLQVPEGSSALTVQDVEDLVRPALGGDRVASLKVVNHPFAVSDLAGAPTEPEGFWSQEFLLELARRVSLGVLVLGVLLMLLVFRRRGKSAGVRVMGAGGATAALAGGGGAERLLSADPDEADNEEIRRGIARALQENPQQVRQLFLSWMENEKGA